MRQTTRFCDRCGDCFTDQPGSVIEVKAGELTKRSPETLDLCPRCSDAFLSFMRSANQAADTRPVKLAAAK